MRLHLLLRRETKQEKSTGANGGVKEQDDERSDGMQSDVRNTTILFRCFDVTDNCATETSIFTSQDVAE